MLNPSIILQAQQPNFLNTLQQANAAAQTTNQLNRERDVQSLMFTQGDKIASGDQQALNALARIDPNAALGIQGTRQDQSQSAGRYEMDEGRYGMAQQSHTLDMQATQQRMQMLSAQERRAIEQHASSLSAADAAAQQADIENDVKVLATAQSPEQWDALAEQTGNPNFVGGFQDREALIAPYLSLKEVLERQTPASADPQSSLGKFYADQAAGLIPQGVEAPQGGVNVNVNAGEPQPMVGTIPQGYARIPDPENPDNPAGFRDVPIPGGKEDTTANEAAAAEAQQQQAQIVLETTGKIREALTKPDQGGRGLLDLPETGIVGGRLARNGLNQEAVDVLNNIAVLQSAVSFDRLQAMREASPTGGALGAVSERELILLQASMGALSENSSRPQMLDTLAQLDAVMTKFSAYPTAGGATQSIDYNTMDPQALLSAEVPSDPSGLAAWNAAMDAAGF